MEFRSDDGARRTERRVFRVRARENPQVNGYWICDIGRYSHPSGRRDRSRFVLMNKDAKTTRLSWDKALIILTEKIQGLRPAREGRPIGSPP